MSGLIVVVRRGHRRCKILVVPALSALREIILRAGLNGAREVIGQFLCACAVGMVTSFSFKVKQFLYPF